jgi:hypothetical protein
MELDIKIDNIQKEDIKINNSDYLKAFIVNLYKRYKEEELIIKGMDIEKIKQCAYKLKEYVEEFNADNSNLDNYFNPISHHLFITPYLLDNMYSSIFQDITHIESMLNVINSIIDGIWYKPDKIFNLKNINPKQFIEICNEMILFYKNNFIDKLFIDNNKLIDYKI